MAERTIFDTLKKLFSSDVVIRNVGGDQLKVVDTNNIQSSGKYQTNSLVDRFTRLYIYNNKNIFNPNLNYQSLRIQLYSDYEAMDTDPIIASALDIIADEACVKSEFGEVLSIKSSDENIQRVLYNLFYDILNIEFNLWSWTRNMAKYGDFFLKLEIAEELGVYNVIPYTVYHISRHEGMDPDNPTQVIFRLNPDGIAVSADVNYKPNPSRSVIDFDNYEVAHFRLLSDTNFLPYGKSYIESARKLYKQLTLLEDAALIHRIMRSPEKRTFFINVGSIPPAEVDQFMQKTINNMKKTPYVGADGQYNLKFNMQNMMEDFYIPVRGNDATTRIETSKGLDYDGMADISYFQAKLFAALKIPKAFFGFEGELSGKATLSAESVRFARTIERIQRILESELTKIALVHLAAQGFKGESLANFDIKLTTPSIVFEQEKIALLKEKVDLAVQMKDSELFASDYIYEKIFDLSEDSYNEMRELVIEDKKQAFRLAQIENEGNDPAKSGRSYGTPHDLASMYGRRSDASTRGGNLGEVPPGYEDDPNPPILPQNKKDTKLGRPVEKKSIYGTNAYPVGGRDPLGKHPGYPSDNENVSETLRTKTLLAKHFGITDAKELFFKKTSKSTSNLLNESNIKDLED